MSDSIWDSIRGQDTPVALLRRSASRGRLAHGYAFFGPNGIGRKLVARAVAQSLFCTEIPDDQLDACGCCPACKQMQAGNHPDLLSVAKPTGKREIPIELIAGRPERRGREGLCYELAMRPMTANRRIAILDDAESMNAESANALLKTLEEPPPGSLLILIATSPDAILPTIRSRVQPLHFNPLPQDDLKTLLVERLGVEPTTADSVAPLAGGSLETAQQLIDEDVRQLRNCVLGAVCTEPFHAVRAATAVNSALDDLGGDAATKRNQADWAFRFLASFLQQCLHDSAGASGSTSERHATFLTTLGHDEDVRIERLGLSLERVVTAEQAVAQMTPVALAVEGLFDDLSAIFRGADRPHLESRA